MIVDPRGVPPMEWCDSTADNLASIMQVMKVDSDDDWRRFGSYTLSTLRRRGAIVPDPEKFTDFEEWAMRFNQVISALQ
jgi:hypothetical protein